jgi:alpha-ketoglutarate-dependent taurine dioxygenase
VFGCLSPPSSGGETPLCDSRAVYDAIPAGLRDKFEQRGILYLRNYGGGLGLDWRVAFRTNVHSDVEAYCRAHQIDYSWPEGDRLRLRWRRPAIVRHHTTGERIWFNQVTHFHISMLQRDEANELQQMFKEDELPRSCRFGDGTPIMESEVLTICEAYRACENVFSWQKGDVLMVDNMLMAHARNPYQGPRKILVALGHLIGIAANE